MAPARASPWLVEAGADVLALETIPAATEVEALLAEVERQRIDCWLSVTCAGDRTRAGEPAAEVFAMARDVDEVIAVGVNCTHPADASALVGIAAAASGKPVVVYPNSGETWDADARRVERGRRLHARRRTRLGPRRRPADRRVLPGRTGRDRRDRAGASPTARTPVRSGSASETPAGTNTWSRVQRAAPTIRSRPRALAR